MNEWEGNEDERWKLEIATWVHNYAVRRWQEEDEGCDDDDADVKAVSTCL
jgi:hypothetical protein